VFLWSFDFASLFFLSYTINVLLLTRNIFHGIKRLWSNRSFATFGMSGVAMLAAAVAAAVSVADKSGSGAGMS
jgi:hypothetical protein